MGDSFEAQCDCELDSPGVLSHLPVDERLEHWTKWALYLKRRIETHYRPLEAELAALKAQKCETCKEWDGPLGNGLGKCCVWTITSVPANPGCGRTHFRDTPAHGFCYRWAAREEA
jgi:hypothetical protein